MVPFVGFRLLVPVVGFPVLAPFASLSCPGVPSGLLSGLGLWSSFSICVVSFRAAVQFVGFSALVAMVSASCLGLHFVSIFWAFCFQFREYLFFMH